MKLATALTATLLVAGSASAAEVIAHRVIDEGYYSAISERRVEIVTSERQWAELWWEHHGFEDGVPVYPEVDFSTEMVVASFMGLQYTMGSRIYVDAIASDGNRCGIKIVDEVAMNGSRVFTTPFQFSAFPRTDQPIHVLENSRKFETLSSGENCDENQAMNLVIRDQGTWEKVWAKTYEKSMAPFVDFGEEMVLAVFMGQMPSNGYDVRIADISDTQALGTTVTVPTVVSTSPRQVSMPVLTSPYHFVVTAATDQAVVFFDLEL